MSGKSILRTPLTYYGGKQKLISQIKSFIPPHKLYAEVFLGGGAVFFAKDKSLIEVVNDTNSELINFYRVAKNRFHELQSLVRITLHSRSQHDDAWIIYNRPHLFDEVRRAWAVWVLCTQSFSSMIDGSWGYDKSDNTTTHKISAKRESFLEDIAIRLQDAQIECADALYIISSRDTVDSFFYCDPPYYNSDCGHYDGYSQQDFEMLLTKLSTIKGKFLLSSYPSDILEDFTGRFKWHTWSRAGLVSVNAKNNTRKKKIEVLTANYSLTATRIPSSLFNG